MKFTGRKASVFGVALSLMAAVLVVPQAHATSGSGNSNGATATLASSNWAPTRTVTLLDNNAGWGNVAIYARWQEQSAGSNYTWGTAWDGVIELGWKRTGWGWSIPQSPYGCHRAASGTFVTTGYPSNVRVQTDTVEDGWDASLWISDIYNLKPVFDANPQAEFAAFWDCSGDLLDNFDDNQGPNLEAQLAEHSSFPPWNNSPLATTSRATQKLIPAENGPPGVPNDGNDLSTDQADAYLPWTTDGGFDSNTASTWTKYGATTQIIGGGLNSSSYLYIQPTQSGLRNGLSTWSTSPFNAMQKWFTTRSYAGGNLGLGSNTTFQEEVSIRCQPWARSWAGTNSTSCNLTLAVNTAAGIQQGHPWCYKTFYSNTIGIWTTHMFDGCGAFPDSTTFLVSVDTNGWPMDIDGLWFGSGI